MKVLKTRPEIKEVLSAAEDVGQRVGHVNIRRKGSSRQLHSGHESLINYCKENFDIVFVSFWNPMESVEVIYQEATAKEINNILKNWDREGCLNWLEEKGIDYVIAPEHGYVAQYTREKLTNIEDVKRWINQVWEANAYPTHTPNNFSPYIWMLTTKAYALFTAYKTPFNMTYVTTWKNGEIVFIFKDFLKKYSPKLKMSILDPSFDTEGLFHSSSHMDFTKTQKQVVQQIRRTTIETGYKDKTKLVKALESLDKVNGKYSIGLKILDVCITEGGVVGDSNVFVNITYSINDKIGYFPVFIGD